MPLCATSGASRTNARSSSTTSGKRALILQELARETMYGDGVGMDLAVRIEKAVVLVACGNAVDDPMQPIAIRRSPLAAV